MPTNLIVGAKGGDRHVVVLEDEPDDVVAKLRDGGWHEFSHQSGRRVWVNAERVIYAEERPSPRPQSLS